MNSFVSLSGDRLVQGAGENAYKRLAGYIGRGGSRAAVRATSDISIPWEDAMAVFRIRRLPHFIDETKIAFPGVT